MKHFLAILLLAAATLAFGAEKIEFDIFGCTMGTPKEKVQKTLSKHNMVLLGDGGDENYVYSGSFNLFGMEWKAIKTIYLSDSLATVELADSCDAEQVFKHKQVTQNIQNMCTGMQDALELPIIQVFFENALKQDSTDIYARYDGHWVLMYFEKDEKISILIVNYEQLFQLVATAGKSISEVRNQMPDYQESNRVTGVAGLKFGDTKASVEAKAKSKWLQRATDEHSSTYIGVSVGGVSYEALTLYYKYDNTKKCEVLVAADMQKHFSTFDYAEAEAAFNSVRSTYNNKYTNEHFAEDGNEKLAGYGMMTPDYVNETLTPILISLRKSLSKGGEFYYYVTVSYFLENAKNLYDDEI